MGYQQEYTGHSCALFVAVTRDGSTTRLLHPQARPPTDCLNVFMGIDWGELADRITPAQADAAKLALEKRVGSLMQRASPLTFADITLTGTENKRRLGFLDRVPRNCIRVYAGMDRGSRKGRLPEVQRESVRRYITQMLAELVGKLAPT